jgi:uncharacterized protein
MLAEVRTIARIQELDDEVHKMQELLAEMPRQIMAEKKALDERKKETAALEAQLAETNSARVRHENELVQHASKLKKLRGQVTLATTEAQLEAFQHEIAFFEKAIGEDEEKVLGLMMRAEELEGEIKERKAAEARALADLQAHFKAAEKKNNEGLEQIKQWKARGAELQKSLTGPFGALYERMRKKFKTGAIVAEAEDGHCKVCLMAMRPALWQEIHADKDKVFHCENCGRILLYDPPEDAYDA